MVPLLHPLGPSHAALAITWLSTALIDTAGGTPLWLKGRGFTSATRVAINGVACRRIRVLDAQRIQCITPMLPTGRYVVAVFEGRHAARSAQSIQVWSPAALAGSGTLKFSYYSADAISQETQVTRQPYWEIAAPDMPADWRGRDGAVLVWLDNEFGPRFMMVGGWNGNPQPLGFGEHNITTNEVWDSPDGAHWTQRLPDQHGQWVRRHTPAYCVHQGTLMLIGGDVFASAEGYQRDVIASRDGVTWHTQTVQTPWSPRMLGMAVSFQGAVYCGFGMTGLRDEPVPVYHNDVYQSLDEGRTWTRVVGQRPASATVPAGRGMVNQWVVYQGRVVMVCGGGYGRLSADDEKTFYKEVWSTSNFIDWTRHADVPHLGDNPHTNSGLVYHAVEVHAGLLWLHSGYSYENPNTNRLWYTDQLGDAPDSAVWTEMPTDEMRPTVGSHAHGFASNGDFILFAGGNHTVPSMGKAVLADWRRPWRLYVATGARITGVADEGNNALSLSQSEASMKPLALDNAFPSGAPGVLCTGRTHGVLGLAAPHAQPLGRSVFWYARIPQRNNKVPKSANAPQDCLVGLNTGAELVAVGMNDGRMSCVSWAPLPAPWKVVQVGQGYSDNAGRAGLYGFTHDSTSHTLQAYVDGVPEGAPATADYPPDLAWQTVGKASNSEALNGVWGCVLVVDGVLPPSTIAMLAMWAKLKYEAPDFKWPRR
jgi:hypothetical protein